jgi:type III pantothenate kinase
MMLLLDLGNSRLKWALAAQHPGPWLAQGALGWDADLPAQLQLAWAQYPSVHAVVAASVVDAARESLVAAAVAVKFAGAPRWVRTPASACGVRNAYAEPQRLGVDRFLAMLAAHAAGYAPCVLAGAGTALTLDALTADGQHLGGLIAPGAQLMQRSLGVATVHARADHAGDIVDVARNTADAVTSGCWHAVAALVERFVQRMTPALGGAPTLVLGGGDAAQLLPLLTLPAHVMTDGVLHGLAHWAMTVEMAAPATGPAGADQRAGRP